MRKPAAAKKPVKNPVKNLKFIITRTSKIMVTVEEAENLGEAEAQAVHVAQKFVGFSCEDKQEKTEDAAEKLYFPQMSSEVTGYEDEFASVMVSDEPHRDGMCGNCKSKNTNFIVPKERDARSFWRCGDCGADTYPILRVGETGLRPV